MNKFTTPGKVKQVNATIIAPQNAGLRLIVNLVGQAGKFDSKLDTILSKMWPKVKNDYREAFVTQHNFKMGSLHQTATTSDCWVVNMLVKDKENKVDSNALALAIKNLAALAKYEQGSVHVSNLLVKEVPELKQMLISQVAENGIHLYFYEEPVK